LSSPGNGVRPARQKLDTLPFGVALCARRTLAALSAEAVAAAVFVDAVGYLATVDYAVLERLRFDAEAIPAPIRAVARALGVVLGLAAHSVSAIAAVNLTTVKIFAAVADPVAARFVAIPWARFYVFVRGTVAVYYYLINQLSLL